VRKNTALIKARKEKGYTQSNLAELMECQKTTISNWENGYAKPKLSDAFKLANILGKNIELIFFEDDIQDSQTETNTALSS
jgi:putative transcriptional regulator